MVNNINGVMLNDRAVRAGAGITFLLGIFSFFQAFYLQEYIYLKVLAPFLFVDFFIKTILGVKYSPLSRLASLIVRGQKSEPVPYAPKRAAWMVGLVLSGSVTSLLLVFNITGVFNLMACLTCLTFMFMETALGICVVCKIYTKFV